MITHRHYIKSANTHRPLVGTVAFLLLLLSTAMAQGQNSSALVHDFLNVQGGTADKIAQLAEAIPAEKYDWRPADGVRSVKESLLHVASGNFYFASLLGKSMPEGLDVRNLEKSEMSKEKAISILKQSVAHVQEAIKNMKDAAFDEEVEFFGNKATRRQVMFIAGDHIAEHLGQLIAYARMNGVVPPWSQKQN